MIVYDMPQGTPEWFQARAGIITASMFGVARSKVGGLTAQQQTFVDAVRSGKPERVALELAGYKKAPTSETVKRALDGEKVGKPSEAALDYAYKLALERATEECLDEEQFETYAMRRGKELEADARMAHELKLGTMVEQVGFIVDNNETFGVSLDGLLGTDGSSEYKCFYQPSKLRRILHDGNLDDAIEQVQGGLWVTGRQWCDFVLYCPKLESIGKHLTVIRVERDQAFIDELERDLWDFNDIVTRYLDELTAPTDAELLGLPEEEVQF